MRLRQLLFIKTSFQFWQFYFENDTNSNERHETPVLDHPIKIVHIDDDLVVLDKPGSIPVSSWYLHQSDDQMQQTVIERHSSI